MRVFNRGCQQIGRWGFLLLCLAGIALAEQGTLTNDSIIKMIKAGLGEDVVLSSIKANPAKFSTGVDDLIALKDSGVNDRIIAAMANKMTVDSTPATAATAGPVSEIGVYSKKGDNWVELAPEVVNFKTGGVLKSIGTAGVVKGDINGHINGNHSTNQVKVPVELLVYVPDGVAITEYQLLRMREQHDSREFRTVTGGVLHVSGGATRDLVTYENKKVAPRTYQIVLPKLAAGEYGLLPPASSDPTASSGRIGKIYSFRIVD